MSGTATITFIDNSFGVGKNTFQATLQLGDPNSDGYYPVLSAKGKGTFLDNNFQPQTFNIQDVVSVGGADNLFNPTASPPNTYVTGKGIAFLTDNSNIDGVFPAKPGSGEFILQFLNGFNYSVSEAPGNVKQSSTLTVTSDVVVCYAVGTRIRTPRGDVAVEELQVGDLVVTASGAQRPIVWLGRRALDCAARPAPRDAWPVRIAAGAFGDNRPERDLYVSPAHAVCVDCVGEVLIPAHLLVNGATITRTPVATIDYWHIELESHDILLANGLPAESYLPMNNRDFFVTRAGAATETRHGAGEGFCRPMVVDGPVLEAVQAQLAARAERLGFTRDHEPNLRLVVDGTELPPLRAERAAVFLLPRNAQDVRLLSSTFVPADDVGGTADARALGACLHGLTLSDGRNVERLALDDARLAESFFPEEAAGGCPWRWTRGEMILPASLLAGFEGAHVTLHVAYETAAPRRWNALAAAEQEDARPKAKLYAVA